MRILILGALLLLASCDGERNDPMHINVATQADEVHGTEGFYRTVKVDGTWWLLDPDNNKFFTIGINHIDPNFFLADEYAEGTLEKYGPGIQHDNKMANLDGPEAIEFMNWGTSLVSSWGFNTLGAQNPITHRTLPWIATFRPADLEGWSFMKRRHPDPFAKKTAAHVFKKASAWSEGKRDDPTIIGVTMTAMPLWHIKPHKPHEWYVAMMRLPADAPGKKAWLKVMRERYPTARAAGEVYGLNNVKNWAELAANQEWSRVRDFQAAQIDQRVFLPRIAKAWYELVNKVIRQVMPNHLIFGDKHVPNRDLDDWLVPIIGDTADVIYLQWFTHADEQVPKLRDLYLQTGKPIIMGDFAFAHPNDRVPVPKGKEVGSQKEVGESYANYVETLANEPYFIGLHHCGTFEGSPSLGHLGPLTMRQQGFMRGDGTPYTEAIKRVTAANRAAAGIHDAIKQEDPLVCETIYTDETRFTHVGERVRELRGPKMAPGSPQKPIAWIIGDEGVAVYDTDSEELATEALRLIREETDAPIKYVVYSHHHATQLRGAHVFTKEGAKIVAHQNLVHDLGTVHELDSYYSRLNSIQFNSPEGRPGKSLMPDITYRDRMDLDLGGVEVELRHVEGEAEDYSVVWLPEERIVMMADLLPGGMPMLASPMKPVRNELAWISALTEIKELEPREVLHTAGIPNCDRLDTLKHLNAHIAWLEFVHAAVIRELNIGSTEAEALENIRLPAELRKSPFLEPRYGTLAFAVRGLYHRYSGWFDMNGSHIKPIPKDQRATAFIEVMGGRDKVLALARQELERNPALAIEYADLLIDANDTDRQAHTVKSNALRQLSPLADNKIEKNMLIRTSFHHKQKAHLARKR